jgi:hypothetical protein
VVRLAFAPDERVHELVDLIRDSPEYVPACRRSRVTRVRPAIRGRLEYPPSFDGVIDD